MKIDIQNKTITLQDGDEIFLNDGTYVKVEFDKVVQDFKLINLNKERDELIEKIIRRRFSLAMPCLPKEDFEKYDIEFLKRLYHAL